MRINEIGEAAVRISPKTGSSIVHVNTGLLLAMGVVFCTLLLVPTVGWTACVCGGGDGIPLIFSPTAPIDIDGDVADWGTTSQTGTVLNESSSLIPTTTPFFTSTRSGQAAPTTHRPSSTTPTWTTTGTRRMGNR
jgi:hypothetical protein